MVVFYTALIGCIEKGLLKAGQRTGWIANGVRTADWKRSTHMMFASFCERLWEIKEWQNWDSQGLLEQLGFELIVPDIESDKDLRAA